MTTSVMHHAFGHHTWATLRLLEACSTLPEDQLELAPEGTFGSIIDTLRHLVGADAAYLSLLTDGAVHEVHESTMDIGELATAMQSHVDAWQRLLERDLDPDLDVVRHRDDGTDSHAPMGIRLAQALHHGTDHRSQVCTALTLAGHEPPAIDVWDFGWSVDGSVYEAPAGD